ncbi:MAG: hypothetical protein ACR2H3_11235 [Acidimicrobiales bacterium]
MGVSEEERRELYLEMERVHGRDRATTLMSLLPPVGWADVATKQDLERLETRMDAKFDLVDAEFVRVRSELATGLAGVRSEIAVGIADVRTDLADVRMDIANSRAGQRVQLLLLFVALVGLQLSGAGIALAVRQLL